MKNEETTIELRILVFIVFGLGPTLQCCLAKTPVTQDCILVYPPDCIRQGVEITTRWICRMLFL